MIDKPKRNTIGTSEKVEKVGLLNFLRRMKSFVKEAW